MAHLGIPGVTEWYWDEGDPEELFFLEEEIAGLDLHTTELTQFSWIVWNRLQGHTQCYWRSGRPEDNSNTRRRRNKRLH